MTAFYKCPACKNRVWVHVELVEAPHCTNHPKTREMQMDTAFERVDYLSLPESVVDWLCNEDQTTAVREMANELRSEATIIPRGRYLSLRVSAEFPGLPLAYEVMGFEVDILSRMTERTPDEDRLLRSLRNALVALEEAVPGIAGDGVSES